MKWEYIKRRYFFVTDPEEEKFLNSMGNDEWQLIQAVDKIYYFKRPIPEPQLAPPPINNEP